MGHNGEGAIDNAGGHPPPRLDLQPIVVAVDLDAHQIQRAIEGDGEA
jgi:hypothetical protein